jgi:hypothetical protein
MLKKAQMKAPKASPELPYCILVTSLILGMGTIIALVFKKSAACFFTPKEKT